MKSYYFDKLAEIQDKIYSIRDNESNLESLGEELSNSSYIESKFASIQLFYSLNNFAMNYPNLSHFINSLLLTHLKKALEYFSSSELYDIFECYIIKLALFENNYIDIDTIIENSVQDYFCFFFFCNEIKEMDEIFYQQYLILNPPFKSVMDQVYSVDHLVLRKIGLNHNKIAKIIRNDDLDVFQTELSSTNLNINEPIPFSFYDLNSILNIKTFMPSMIEYAAFYGSSRIFKFLWMNNAERSERILLFSVASGNYDIIHLIESEMKYNEACLDMAIRYHHNDLISYINESKEISYTTSSFVESLNQYHISELVNMFSLFEETIKTNKAFVLL